MTSFQETVARATLEECIEHIRAMSGNGGAPEYYKRARECWAERLEAQMEELGLPEAVRAQARAHNARFADEHPIRNRFNRVDWNDVAYDPATRLTRFTAYGFSTTVETIVREDGRTLRWKHPTVGR